MVASDRFLALAGALALLLAGCAAQNRAPVPEDADPEEAPTAPPAEHDDETCGIEGSVVDQDYLPIAGAQVDVLSAEKNFLTTADGRFGFSYLPAGRHQLVASLTGYDSATALIDCLPGDQVKEATLVLNALEKVEPPFFSTYHAKGRIGCSWGFLLESADLCKKGSFNANNPGLDPHANSTIAFSPDPRASAVTGAVYEVQWTRSQGFGSDFLRLTYFLPNIAAYPIAKSYCPKTKDITAAQSDAISGPSVLCVRLNPENKDGSAYRPGGGGTWHPVTFRVLATENVLELTSSPSPNGWQDENSKLIVGQDFDLYVTWFYNGARAPEGFTAIG